MLIKKADDKRQRLAELEAAMTQAGPAGKHAKDAFHILKAGIKGEEESAYLIDFHYGESSRNWAVLHDLRLEHGGRVAQLDHVLINRFLEVYALETKHFNSGVKVTEEGEFLRWNDFRKKFEGMESPIEQNKRHIAVLKDVFNTMPLPERLGLRMQPSFHSYVMVATRARIDRPKKFDTSRVIKADHLKQKIDREFDGIGALQVLAKTSKLVSAETVRSLALELARQHRPLVGSTKATQSKPSRVVVAAAPVVAPQSTLPGPSCKACGKGEGHILYGNSYYFKCAACATNTSIRFTCKPGHSPRLRKAGNVFFRDCKECGSSDPFHVNMDAA